MVPPNNVRYNVWLEVDGQVRDNHANVQPGRFKDLLPRYVSDRAATANRVMVGDREPGRIVTLDTTERDSGTYVWYMKRTV